MAKVSAKEVQRLRNMLRRQAELIVRDLPALDDAHRQSLVRNIADDLLAGLEELLQRGYGRTRLRRAVDEMLWDAYQRYEQRIGLEVLRAEYQRRLLKTLDDYAMGRIDRETAERRLDRLIDTYHRAAYRAGRESDGQERRPGEQHGRAMAVRNVNKQRVRDFLDKIDHRQQSGKPYDVYMQWRAALYPGSLNASYWWGWLETLPDNARILWVMDPLADHCDDCPKLEAGGPYTKHNIPTVPGNGDTECLTNCRCHLEVLGE